MKKIISLYQRNHGGDELVRNEITPGAEWVAAGEGVATRKWDGTCCLVRGGRLFKRYQVNRGGVPPLAFEPACEVDATTGKQQGWVPVSADNPSDKYHVEAFGEERAKSLGRLVVGVLPDGTYELCGPKVQGNPDRFLNHTLIPHGGEIVDAPRAFEALMAWLADADIEGVVWHHPDGRMVKIKGRDFGLNRKAQA